MKSEINRIITLETNDKMILSAIKENIILLQTLICGLKHSHDQDNQAVFLDTIGQEILRLEKIIEQYLQLLPLSK